MKRNKKCARGGEDLGSAPRGQLRECAKEGGLGGAPRGRLWWCAKEGSLGGTPRDDLGGALRRAPWVVRMVYHHVYHDIGILSPQTQIGFKIETYFEVEREN